MWDRDGIGHFDLRPMLRGHKRLTDSVPVLVLLDLSVAFDIIIHSNLLDLLQGLGIGGMVLQEFLSFLHGQFQLVVARWEGEMSTSWLLSPLLFNIYMKLLMEVIQWFGVQYHKCPGDTL